MNKDYQQGRQDVKDIKETGEQIKERARGAIDETTQPNQSLWDKTMNVAKDVKDTVVDTAQSAYQSTKEFVAGTNPDQRNVDQNRNLNLDQNRNLNLDQNRNIGQNKDIHGQDYKR